LEPELYNLEPGFHYLYRENVAASGVSLVVTGGTLDAVAANVHDSVFSGGATGASTTVAITPSVNGSRTAAVAVQAASTGADLLAALQ